MEFFATLSPGMLTGMQAAMAGLVGGLMLGAGAQASGFCTLAALETALFGSDWRRLHIWGIVLGVAILGTQLGSSWGLVDIGNTIYHSFVWNPVASILGGLIFGYGMAMAGNCGFGALVRAGGGDIRSLVIVVVLGIASFFTLSGPLAYLREALFPLEIQTEEAGITAFFHHWLGILPETTATIISATLIAWGLSHSGIRRSSKVLLFSVLTGLSVVWCFAATTAIHRASMGGIFVEGPSFSAPVGRTILYFMTSSGNLPSFSVGLVTGTFLGGAIGAFLMGSFRWEACDDPRELGRQMGGAVLMGVGGVVAVGCSIGQGLSAFAVLSWSAPITLLAICIGAYHGLTRLLSNSPV